MVRIVSVFYLLALLISPLTARAEENQTRVANWDNYLISSTRIDKIDDALPVFSLPLKPLHSALFVAQWECREADFNKAKAALLGRLDIDIKDARQRADEKVGDPRSPWDLLLKQLVEYRDFARSFVYSPCQKTPDLQQARAAGDFRRLMGARSSTCADGPCPPSRTTVFRYEWASWPTLGRLFERLMFHQRICDEKSFAKQKQELESFLKKEVIRKTDKADQAKKALDALQNINFVPCDDNDKAQSATAGSQSAGTTDQDAATGNETGPTRSQRKPTGQRKRSKKKTSTAPDDDAPLPGVDDDKIGLLDLWLRPEITVSFSGGSFDSSPALYGQFVGSGQAVFDAGDIPNSTCGGFNIYGISVPIGFNFAERFLESLRRVSVFANICKGDDDRVIPKFQSGQNFLLGQPNGGTQLINGNILFNQVTLSRQFNSIEGGVGLGGPIFQSGSSMVTGNVTVGFRHLETEDRAQFAANNINFQSTSTQQVESWSGGLDYTLGFFFSPNGPTVPQRGLQTIFLKGHGGLHLTSVDATDTFDTFQIGNFAETQRVQLSETKVTTSYGVTAGVRWGLTNSTALTVEGFWKSIEVPVIRRQVGQPSQLDFEHVHNSGVRGSLNVMISDIRLKRDISQVATLQNGIRIYSFKYLWDDTVHVGVMAQEILSHESARDAVQVIPSGYYAVDYEKLGLQMTTIEEWRQKGVAAVVR